MRYVARLSIVVAGSWTICSNHEYVENAKELYDTNYNKNTNDAGKLRVVVIIAEGYMKAIIKDYIIRMQSDWRMYPDDPKKNNAPKLIAAFNEFLYKTATDLSQVLLNKYNYNYEYPGPVIMLPSQEAKERERETQKPVSNFY